MRNLIPTFALSLMDLRKLDNILGFKKLAGNKGGLIYSEKGSHATTSSENTFVPISIKTKSLEVTKPKKRKS